MPSESSAGEILSEAKDLSSHLERKSRIRSYEQEDMYQGTT
jgi:hypothetical protein